MKAYVNPVDQKTYVAADGWETYQAASPAVDRPGSKVNTDHVPLLTAQDDLEKRVNVQDLAAFCKEVQRIAEESLGGSGKEFKVMVQFTCTASGRDVQLAHQGEAPPELLQAFYDALAEMNKLPVLKDEVVFQVQITVSG